VLVAVEDAHWAPPRIRLLLARLAAAAVELEAGEPQNALASAERQRSIDELKRRVAETYPYPAFLANAISAFRDA